MATRISRTFDFLGAVYYEGSFLMNQYTMTLSMDVMTDSIIEQNIAMDRMKYLVDEVLDSVVFIQDSETRMIEKYQAAGLKVSTLPDEPYDQIVTLLLLYKLNSICEGRLIVTHIELDSLLSDGVGFMYDIEDLDMIHPYKQGWWTENTIAIADKTNISKKEKIVKLVKKSDWASLGLDWKERESKPAEIIFTPDTQK